MTLAETIYQHSLQLPEPAAREALAFINPAKPGEALWHRPDRTQSVRRH
ncbi:MAG: hypothetical protein U1F76_28980 [Candidatus Competibacteraceae bacterium]